MELAALAEFETVARCASFRVAASELSLSPSALSSHIRNLETDLGAVLLERTTRSVVLTAAGKALLDETRGSVAQLQRAAELVKRIHLGQAERIRIGHSDAAAVELLQQAVSGLLDRYPGLHLFIEEQPNTELVARLTDNRLDRALLRPPLQHPDLDDELLYVEPIVALVPDGHDLASHTSVTLAEIAKYPLILPPRTLSPTVHDTIFKSVLTSTGVVPAISQEAAGTTSFLILVSAGAGISLLPVYTTRHLRLTGITTLTINDDIPPLPLHIAWQRNNSNPILLTLKENLHSAARRLRTRTKRRSKPARIDGG